jgi:HEPN domain-containing protein
MRTFAGLVTLDLSYGNATVRSVKPETEHWFRRAELHLGAAKLIAEAGGQYAEHAIFWCQQALEMLIKAIIIERLRRARLGARTISFS